MKIYLTSFLALATVAACTPGNNTFVKEAGAVVENPDFGSATLNNTLTHTGANNVAINLQRRFAAEVDTTVNFAFNSAVLDGEARATLAQQANWIRQFPEIKFKVYGHTDLVGTNAYNRSLGMRRAHAVVAFLSTQGISRSRLEAAVSLGETQPLVATEEMERRNRRTVTEVSGFARKVRDDELNGKYAQIIFREYIASGVPRATVAETQTTLDGG